MSIMGICYCNWCDRDHHLVFLGWTVRHVSSIFCVSFAQTLLQITLTASLSVSLMLLVTVVWTTGYRRHSTIGYRKSVALTQRTPVVIGYGDPFRIGYGKPLLSEKKKTYYSYDMGKEGWRSLKQNTIYLVSIIVGLDAFLQNNFPAFG